MDTNDLGMLRKELLAHQLIAEGASEAEVRRMGERLGSWAASSKRQCLPKVA